MASPRIRMDFAEHSKMPLHWLFPLCLALLFSSCIGEMTKGSEATELVSTPENQILYTTIPDDQSSTPNMLELLNTLNASNQLLGAEEYDVADDILQQAENTVKANGSESATFPFSTALLTNETNSTEGKLQDRDDHHTDICNINNTRLQQQLPLEWEDPTNATTVTCKSGNTGSGKEQLASSRIVAIVRVVTQEILPPIIALPGCFFNIICVYVLVKQGAETSSARFLLALSVADLCYLVAIVLNWILVLLSQYQYHFYVSSKLVIMYFCLRSYFLYLTGRCSNVIVLLLSLDRFIAIKFPLKAKRSLLSRHPVKFAFAAFVFLAILLLPNLFRANFVQMSHSDTNKFELVIENTPFYVIHSVIVVATVRLVPVLFTFVLNVAIICVVKFGSRVTKHTDTENRQRRELKLTRMLVTISLIFLICVTPGLLHSIVANLYPAYSLFGPYRNIFLVLYSIVPILDVINSTVNFFVYVVMSDRFRAVLFKTFPCRRD